MLRPRSSSTIKLIAIVAGIALCASLVLPTLFVVAAKLNNLPDAVSTPAGVARSNVAELSAVGAAATQTAAGQATQGGDAQTQPVQSAAAGTLRGQVFDQLGGVVVGAGVKLSKAGGVVNVGTTDGEGRFFFRELAAGVYSIAVEAKGFAAYEQGGVRVGGGEHALRVELSVTIGRDEVTVYDAGPKGNGLSSRVLRGKDIAALPVGPGGLEAALRALAVPTTGPAGPQIIVNGFPGGQLPPKESIREIRINEDPFSAQYPQLGFGRVEIFTKPGTDTLQFKTYFDFNDESLNSRNLFAPDRAPYQSRLYGGSVSGPFLAKRASFFADYEKTQIVNNSVVNATILNSSLVATRLSQSVLTPQSRTVFGPRVDYQLNSSNTLTARYSFVKESSENSGVGEFSLPSRALNSSAKTQTLQLTETAVLSPRTVNETRFEFVRGRREQRGDSSAPAIIVPEAFTGGGAPTSLSSSEESRWQLHNYTSLSLGGHLLKFGGQVRAVRLADVSRQDFNGAFLFAGGLAPQLDAGDAVVRNASGQVVLVPVTGLERYRRTLLFERQGLSPAAACALGGGATQLTLNDGNPRVGVSQYEAAVFGQDEWRLRPNLSVNAGLRAEAQTNVSHRLDFAPRMAVAWSPTGAGKQSNTTVRAGVGLFYDRFDESYTLEARRFNGVNQQQYIVTDGALLNSFPNLPAAGALSNFAVLQTIRRVASDLRAPYSVQSSVSVERQLTSGFTLGASYISTRGFNLLRSRNLNAPLTSGAGVAGGRPFTGLGEAFQYESSGKFKQEQLAVNTVGRFRSMMTLWATYVLGKASGDTDGAGTFPANPYNLKAEYGPSSLDVRHSFYFGGWIVAPWGLSINPLIVARSGAPFNITTGQDTNGDSLFTERPAFATDLTRVSVVRTRWGTFDLAAQAGQIIIPRNYGRGPGYFSVNLGVSKTFNFNKESKDAAAPAPQDGLKGRLSRLVSARGYSLTVGIQAENLLNRANLGLPAGNLSSPNFGQSYYAAGSYGLGSNSSGNRRVALQVSLNF